MIITEEDYLEHFGKKGMKWGVRQGKGTTGVSRSSGALMDRNARVRDAIEKTRAGEKHRVAAALGKKLVGAQKQNENWDKTLSNLHKQDERLKSGKLLMRDRLDKFGSISAADLVVSRTPKK